MARGDRTKKPAFEMWLAGKTVDEIVQAIQADSTTERASIQGWIKDWERGKQRTWNAALPR